MSHKKASNLSEPARSKTKATISPNSAKQHPPIDAMGNPPAVTPKPATTDRGSRLIADAVIGPTDGHVDPASLLKMRVGLFVNDYEKAIGVLHPPTAAPRPSHVSLPFPARAPSFPQRSHLLLPRRIFAATAGVVARAVTRSLHRTTSSPIYSPHHTLPRRRHNCGKQHADKV